MNGVTGPPLAWVLSFLVILHLWTATGMRAQASVPGRGEGTLTLTYQNYDVVGHFDAQGHENENGGTRSHALVAELDYGVLDKVGLLVSIPFIASKYTGPPSYFVGPFLTYRVRLMTGNTTQRFRICGSNCAASVGPAGACGPHSSAVHSRRTTTTVSEAVP